MSDLAFNNPPSLAKLLALPVKDEDIQRLAPHEDQSDVFGRDNQTIEAISK